MESRSKFIKDNELCLWEGVTQELMSDEEDFKLRPGLEITSLNELIRKLDQRKEEDLKSSGKQPARKIRKSTESPMKRMPSSKIDGRFLKCQQNASENDNEEDCY